MLVLSRKQDQDIIIGDNIKIKILKVKGNTIRIGIEAPRDVRVVRGELPTNNAAYPLSPSSIDIGSETRTVPVGADKAGDPTSKASEANVTIVFSNQNPTLAAPSPIKPKLDVIPFSRTSPSNSSREGYSLCDQSQTDKKSEKWQPSDSQPEPSSVRFRQTLPATLQHNRLKELVKQLTRDV